MIDNTIKRKLRFNDPLTFTESHILYDCVKKLEQIGQIVNSWDCAIVTAENDWKYIKKIKKVLEQE